jgi:hypothetical protein
MSIFSQNEEYAPDNNSLAPKKPLAMRIAGLVLKVFFWSIIIFINAFFLWRVFSSGDPREVKTLEANDEIRRAYAAYLADKSEDKAPFAVYQREHKTITDERGDEENGIVGNYGYFALTDVAIIPSASQVQVVFRYNNSTLEALVRDYALDFEPDREEIWFDVTCRAVYDSTPNNPDDDIFTERRYTASASSPAWKTLYTYEQLTFKGITEIDKAEAIYIDIYYINDVEYSARPYGSLCIYLKDYTDVEYKLDRNDKRALTGNVPG